MERINRTKDQLRSIAQTALKTEYGFAPAKSAIILLESNGDGTYIMFRVRDVDYSFESHLCYWDNSVWCGKGTITKIEVRPSECAYGENW